MIFNTDWDKQKSTEPIGEPGENNSLIDQIKHMESGPESSVRSLFPENYTFPPSDSLDEKQLNEKTEEILSILSKYNIYVECPDTVPDKLLYNYIIDHVLTDKVAIPEKNSSSFITYGCNAYCPDCFQKGYCEEDLSDEWDEED
ncbi:hypothetical protein CHISP_3258 [Chitinispirillum alkaliphilum]|nr:hypothetical protein CHISP_3258 [Chitinispirillum alkaliphilum]